MVNIVWTEVFNENQGIELRNSGEEVGVELYHKQKKASMLRRFLSV